ncbi:MAG: molybdenum cofactor biosynthesis F family protein [Deltaproteobacteria bacterium]|nr:molybdenum cofactor biosynthesis F family protein [Deltaproteobacteria bacterium]
MPQKEGETDYKYEDYAADMAYHRIPVTADLVNQKMKLTLDSGTVFDLEFTKPNEVNWQSGAESGTDWYEAIEVAPSTYYIDMMFTHAPRECRTFFVNTETRQVLSVHTVMREGDVGKEPRAIQDFTPGVLGDPAIPPTGMKPAPTRDLIGLRALYTYNPNQCFEHIYLNGERYAWHCVVGPLKGESDVELHITYKFDVNQYIFSWREFGLPVSTVFFHNWDQMRETGKFFAIGEDGAIANTPAGALIRKLSVTFYPEEKQPL